MRPSFDPGTPEAVRRILERYRKSGDTLRIVLGDPETGRDWHEENDVVGTVGRSMGPMKIPLLIEKGERGGPAMLTRCIVRIIDWDSQRELYVHPQYQLPALAIVPNADAKYPWEVTIDGESQARFTDLGKAGAYVGFMRGLSGIKPRVFPMSARTDTARPARRRGNPAFLTGGRLYPRAVRVHQ